MNKLERYNQLISHLSPHIPMSYVVDEPGEMLCRIEFHPQICGEIILKLHDMKDTATITTEDLRHLGEWLMGSADLIEGMVDDYNNQKRAF